jgi:hypothetical protein
MVEMKRSIRETVSLLLVLTLTACATATKQPWAEVIGDRVAVGDSSASPVQFLAVDGNSLIGAPAWVQMEPGLRALTLATERGRKPASPKSRVPRPPAQLVPSVTLALDARPCMRYLIQARHDEGLSDRRWRAEMARIEPIAQCFARFPQLGAPPPAMDLPAGEPSIGVKSP